MDVLDTVLDVVGVRGTVAATLSAGEPWGLALNAVPGAAFHALTHGTAWLRMSGRPDIRLMPGDVVLLPTGLPHTLASGPDAHVQEFDHLAAEQAHDGELRVGADDPQTRILCASYHQDPAITLPLLGLLPEVLHVPAQHASTALTLTLQLLAHELGRDRPGTGAVLNRVVDILLVHLLRTWLASTGTRPASWLRALTDPVAGPALTALHERPGHPWTVESLAAHVGVSPATLRRRFRTQVGDSPATYLTRWRMDLAAQRLRDTDDTVATIARALGYTSEHAFNRAFTRSRHTPPGRFRGQHRT